MLYETKNISSEAQLGFDAPIFLRKMQTSASEIIFASGFPLDALFKGPWTASESAKPFRSYLRGCDTKTELLEKTLHRVLVRRIQVRIATRFNEA